MGDGFTGPHTMARVGLVEADNGAALGVGGRLVGEEPGGGAEIELIGQLVEAGLGKSGAGGLLGLGRRELSGREGRAGRGQGRDASGQGEHQGRHRTHEGSKHGNS